MLLCCVCGGGLVVHSVLAVTQCICVTHGRLQSGIVYCIRLVHCIRLVSNTLCDTDKLNVCVCVGGVE